MTPCFIRSLSMFGAGVYVGTYYDCKPWIYKVERFIRDNIPERK